MVFDDGTKAAVEEPRYEIVDTGYGPLDPSFMTSPRVAPPMIGLGLLEAVDAADILARADPDDADGDGISGRARRVWSPERGIGLTEVVNGHTRFLHDGRARNLVEAILWHGGEAEAATAAFRSMSPKPERDALLAFLNSL